MKEIIKGDNSMSRTIKQILGESEYNKLSQFTDEEKQWLNDRVQNRADGKDGIECIVRGLNSEGDYYELTPEEIVRQLYAHKFIEEYGYKKEQLSFEVPVFYAGTELITDKRIDIAIFNKDDNDIIDVIVEVKRPKITDVNTIYDDETSTPFQQMQSYCRQKQSKIGVIANGGNLLKFYDSPNFDEELTINYFPKADEDLQEWKENRRFTIKQLMQVDRLQNETLKEIIEEVEQRFGANDSSDKAFDEIFKLIFIKLYDEYLSGNDADAIAIGMNTYHQELKDIDDSNFRVMQFRVRQSDTIDEIVENMNELFKKAKDKWKGVFDNNSTLDMQGTTIKSCVRELQDVKLFNSNLEVVDDAFEHLVNQNQKGDMGQYFTPRYVIDMCVKMLNPKQNETMIDTASGSCGFPMHTIFHVWHQMNPNMPNMFTTRNRSEEETEYARNNVFGIDFSEKSVRVGRMLNIIAGDGHTNVIELNTLDYPQWRKSYLNIDRWKNKYQEGFTKLSNLSSNPTSTNDKKKFGEFTFDILMANPPFAGKINTKEQLEQYDLSKKNGKQKKSAERDVLFIERNLKFLKPGGRMAIVLPQGRLNNSNDKYIRDYITDKCRILAVVGLHGNVFKPHTGTKTSVLFLQKWTDETCGYPNICPKPLNQDGELDYPIFFATMKEPSKDNSGDKIYVIENYVYWTEKKYITEEIYIRKADKVQVDFSEYNNGKKKDYTKKIQTRVIKEEHKTDDGKINFIKDIFVDRYGELDSHMRWQQKNVKFIKKKNAPNDYADEVTLQQYLDFVDEVKKYYKEIPILGENDNASISIDEYNEIPKEHKKYYLPVEEIIETTERVRDTHGHIFVKHDLFNHDTNLENPNPNNIYSKDGIAEAFIEFAKRENLSFFQ